MLYAQLIITTKNMHTTCCDKIMRINCILGKFIHITRHQGKSYVHNSVVWTSLGPLLGGPLGLLDLCYTVPAGVERKDYRGIVLG
jgi:hypothetical protein